MERRATMRWQEGDEIALVGGAAGSLGGSEYLAQVHGLTAGSPPSLDLVLESSVQLLVQRVIAEGQLRTAHDCSDGGLAVALAEMAIASGLGAMIDIPSDFDSTRLDRAWFGEGASRIVVSGRGESIAVLRETCASGGVPFQALGQVGGERLAIGQFGPVAVTELTSSFESGLRDRERTA
jgi:phosphoribosylformylglycinamidine synthase subunit PurL